MTTRKGDEVFVHVLDWPDASLTIPAIDARVLGATMLDSGRDVSFTQTADGVTLVLPEAGGEEIDRVVVLEVARP